MSEYDGMDSAFAANLQALIAASGGRIRITSGYRDVATQQRLWDNAVAKYGSPEAARKWVAPPGKSNHNHGIAADLGGDLALAHQLAPQFGLWFPMEWEAWHIEPVGSRSGGNRDAYTTPPAGSVNPLDKDVTNDVNYMAASLYSALGDGTTTSSVDIGSSAVNVGSDVNLGPESTTEPAKASAGTSGNVTADQVYQALRAQGLDDNAARQLTAIAGRESGYNTAAHNLNAATGDNSFGLFQINKHGGMHAQWSDEELLTLEGSARAAAELYRESGLYPWGGYRGTDPLANTTPYTPSVVI